ncbi:MAG: Ni/Fe hydrogenase subunit alpha [archaeon]
MAKKITLNHITKIEGHAKLNLGIDKGKVTVCELAVTEGARYFEGIVRGRKYFEAHEMTSRICGICSCGHVVASLLAIEDAIGVVASPQSMRLRELMTLGERIRSHATHLYFLALPDYLGYESALAMAPKYKAELKTALSMIKVGNGIIKTLAARDMHPVSGAVGGWLRLPAQEAIDQTTKDLAGIKAAAKKTCDLFASLSVPGIVSEGDWFSLSEPDKYAMISGDVVSGKTRFERHRYREFIKEHHEDYSTANFVVREGKRYMAGALARLNNNHEHLSKDAKTALKKSKLTLPSRNPFHNNSAQAIELLHSIDEAMMICNSLTIHPEQPPKHSPRPGTGIAAIEVPRGTLWHEYTIDEHGLITNANIITPTAQNLLNMQEDIRAYVPSLLSSSKEEIVLSVEKLIRAYDPCFSCSAHFLEINWL